MRQGRALFAIASMALAGCGLIAQLRDIELTEPTDGGIGNGEAGDSPGDTSVTDTTPACVPAPGACCAPDPGTLAVAPAGSDVTGNGSESCPFKTIGVAVAAAGSSTTVVKIAAGTYGTACTGGAPCDATPITIAGAGQLTLRGAGTGSVIVTGPGRAVFVVQSSGVGFASMTIRPTAIAPLNTAGHGVVYEAPAGGAGPNVTSVHIELASASAFDAGPDAPDGAGPGTGIVIGGGVSPTIGPDVLLSGGYLGIDVSGSSSPHLTGSVAAPTIVSGSGPTFGCVRVKSDETTPAAITIDGMAGVDAGTAVTLTTCTPNLELDTKFAGAGSKVSTTTMLWPSGGGFTPGLIVTRAGKLTLSSSTLDGSVYYGMRIDGSASVAIDHTSSIGNYYPLSIGGNAIVSLDTYTMKGSIYGAVDCGASATVKIRSSTIVGNKQSGVSISGNCNADLGTAIDPGNNVFNRTSQANAWSALCYTSNTGSIAAAGNTWSCANAAATCNTTMTPTRSSGPDGGAFTCQTGTDIATPTQANVQALSPTCCN